MEPNVLHRKETLVFTTIDVINEFGVQGVSTKEVAKRQGIAESTIFKHYKSKNELLLAVLDYYAQYDSDIFISAKDKINNPLEAIIFLLKAYTEYYENYPAITAITQAYDVMACDPELGERVKSIYSIRILFMKELVEAAVYAGQLDPNTDPEKLTDIIWGTSTAICLKWRFSGYGFPLKEYTLSTVQTILDAFSSK